MRIYSTTKYYLILNAYSKCWGYIHFLNYMIGDKVVTYHNDFCVVFRIKQCNQYEFIQLVRIYALTYNYKGHFRNNVSFLQNFKNASTNIKYRWHDETVTTYCELFFVISIHIQNILYNFVSTHYHFCAIPIIRACLNV